MTLTERSQAILPCLIFLQTILVCMYVFLRNHLKMSKHYPTEFYNFIALLCFLQSFHLPTPPGWLSRSKTNHGIEEQLSLFDIFGTENHSVNSWLNGYTENFRINGFNRHLVYIYGDLETPVTSPVSNFHRNFGRIDRRNVNELSLEVKR